MDTWRLLILSHGSLLLGMLVLTGLVRRAWRHARHSEAQSVARDQQVQTVRDALHAWLVEGTPADVPALQLAIERCTALHSWWLDADSTIVTETQVMGAPFRVETHLATLALQKGHTVHQHQLAQWDWASSYVPVCSPGHPHALLVLTSTHGLGAADHAFAVALAEMLCNAWVHAPVKPAAAIKPT